MNQKIEQIHVQGRAASVDELRVGGQTQNITVQPKGNFPVYQVEPVNNGSGGLPQGQTDVTGDRGKTHWNVLKF
ncbi:MAG: hypothetical protein LBV61_08105 [Burkholderiaceae bacterium]|nr:hypothetical protein [Burkholderiaceae bacterium]